jgi:hypothetical protein
LLCGGDILFERGFAFDVRFGHRHGLYAPL